jgi:hypothetical protein
MESDASTTAAESIDSVGFWLSFVLIVGISALEAIASIFWTRIHVKSQSTYFFESMRVCGHEIYCHEIRNEEARAIFEFRGCMNGETTIDVYGSIYFVSTIAIRQFDPSTSLEGASELFKSFSELFQGDSDIYCFAKVVDLFVVLVDISLGVSGLILIPSAPQMLLDTLQDVTAPMTLENYLTLLMLWWILGVILFVAMLPLRSPDRRVHLFGWPGLVASFIANMAGLVLFGLGCWKIDYARRNGLNWTPMLSYWIGGASSIRFNFCGIEIFHTFGLVGLVFLLLGTF